LRGQEFLNKLDEELEKQFPEKFGKRTSPVEGNTSGGGSTRGSSKKQSFENLPADAKAACDRFIKSGMIKNRDAYVAEYDWS
ncbi:MAG: hypothetical protein NUV97_03520, partial [archaeon]|nr:hypothetical protein [archaeon]